MTKKKVALNDVVLTFTGDEKELLTSCLENPQEFGVEWVKILIVKEGFRLLAGKEGKLVFDQIFKTLDNAKIEFLREYYYKKIMAEAPLPTWTPLIKASTFWLEEFEKITKKDEKAG